MLPFLIKKREEVGVVAPTEAKEPSLEEIDSMLNIFMKSLLTKLMLHEFLEEPNVG